MHGVRGGHRHDGDRNGGTVHIDGRTERNGHRIHVLIQSKLHNCMLTGMFAAELRVKNAVRPDSL